MVAEGEARLTPCETETPKSTKNSCFKAGSDYSSHPKHYRIEITADNIKLVHTQEMPLCPVCNFLMSGYDKRLLKYHFHACEVFSKHRLRNLFNFGQPLCRSACGCGKQHFLSPGFHRLDNGVHNGGFAGSGTAIHTVGAVNPDIR